MLIRDRLFDEIQEAIEELVAIITRLGETCDLVEDLQLACPTGEKSQFVSSLLIPRYLWERG